MSIADAYGQNMNDSPTVRRCMMDKMNSVLLSIGAVLLFSLFFASPIVMAAEPASLMDVQMDPDYILFGVGLIALVVGLIAMVGLAAGGWRYSHEDHEPHGQHVHHL